MKIVPIFMVAVAVAAGLDPGMILPGHPLYFLDKIFDDFFIAISPDKVSATIAVMNERIAEFQATGSTEALNDYMTKLSYVQSVRSVEDKEKVESAIKIHEQVLKSVRNIVPEEAKIAIDRAINESTKVYEVIKKMDKFEKVSVEIYAPNTVSVGQSVDVKVRLCNPTDMRIETVHVEAKVEKVGIEGIVMKKEFERTFPVSVEPQTCVERTFSITVPESFFGIPTKGTWKIKVEVSVNGVEVHEQELLVKVV